MHTNPIYGGAVSILALCAFAPLANAEVSADDVWANMFAYTAAFGGTLAADLQRSGDTVTANDIKATFAFPKASGQAVIGISGIAMIENPDGTVSILYAADPKLSLSGMIAGEGDGGADLILHPGTYSIVASGAPGDITYDSTYSEVSLELSGLQSSQSPEMSQAQSTFDFQLEGWTSKTRVTETELVSVVGSSKVLPYRYSVKVDSDTLSIAQSGSSGAMTSDYSFALPAGGWNLMSLGAAFDKGMFFELTSSVTDVTSTSKTIENGRVLSDQTSAQASSQGHFRLDGTALSASGQVAGTEFSTRMDGLPFVIAVDVNALSLDITLPISASPEEQAFAYRFDISGLRLGSDIWAQFDPDKTMPRDPANLRVDLNGSVLLGVDLLDGTSVMAAAERADLPVKLTALTVTDLQGSALGALAAAAGAFTFHNDDMTSFPGMPRPEGTGSVTITGLNALLDMIVGAGALTQDDVMGMRMGMSMFTDAVGEDQIRSEVTIDPAGGITVNGQRIK